MNHLTVGVVGNPNCGKTTLFNVLTGTKQRVGNWPGVTVDKKVGHYSSYDKEIALVDLPGIYSLDVTPDHTSVDEQITQEYILSGEPHLIINIVDASNLERNLYLTSQLLEMGVPLIIVVNMIDIAKQRCIDIDLNHLSFALGVPVVPISAAKKEGIEHLKEVINHASTIQAFPQVKIPYSQKIEEALAQLLPPLLLQLPGHKQAHARWIALQLLETDAQELHEHPLASVVTTLQGNIRHELKEEIDILIADSRYSFISTVINKTVTKAKNVRSTLSDQIDQWVLNRFIGVPLFLLVMYLMFTFTVNFGGAFIDFFDLLIGTVLIDGFSQWLMTWGMPTALTTLFAKGMGGGIQVVATFIPIIACLFLFLAFLEDCGYMARAAFVMDRFMRFIGLPGKSFVPLIVGFGCNVPAVMATRILENQRDRLLTILMTPFMSCGARLAIYALFAVAFFSTGGQNIVFVLYLIGILAAILTGLVMKNTLLKGETIPFLMELPPYHLPTLQNVFLHTWERLRSFIFTAGQMIVPMVMVLTFLNSWGTDGSFGHENSRQSVLSEIGRSMTPLFEPMGLSEDNWPATVGIFTGILAKEAVVGTLNALYTPSALNPPDQKEASPPSFNLWEGVSQAFATIPTNLGNLVYQIFEPGNFSASASETSKGTLNTMASYFDGQRGALAYLLFLLLYFPCTATLAAIYRETNLKWTIFSALWNTGLAYFVAVTFYQITTFTRHPWYSIAWIGGFGIILTLVLIILHRQPSKSVRSQKAIVGGM